MRRGERERSLKASRLREVVYKIFSFRYTEWAAAASRDATVRLAALPVEPVRCSTSVDTAAAAAAASLASR